MTAKEKAKELYGKYFDYDYRTNPNGIDGIQAKKCAIIAVDEIIKLIGVDEDNKDCDNAGIASLMYPYWRDVKSELTNI